jgi:DHA1 family inner membrane transport protein
MRGPVPEMTAPTSWGIVALAVGAGIVGGLQVGKVPPVLPLIRDDLGLSLVTAGWVASTINVCGALLGLALGLVAGRLGPVRVLAGALVAMAVGSAVGATAGGAPAILASRLIEGIGFLAAGVAAPPVILAAVRGEDRSLAMGFWSIYLPAGAATAMLASPIVVEWVGWRGAWWGHAGLALGYAGLVWTALAPARWSDAPRPTASRSWREVRSTLALPGPWLFGGCFAIYTAQYFAVTTWVPTYLTDVFGWGLAEAAFAGACVVAINVAGNLGAAWAMWRGVPRWVLVATSYAGIAVASWFIFAAGAPDAARLPAALALTMVGGMLPAACFAGGAAHARHAGEIATTAGIVVQGANVGSVVGAPALASAIVLLGGWEHGYGMMWALGALGLLVTVTLVRRVDGRTPPT